MSIKTKILITGATGFIGSHVTKRLVEDGFDVAIIKRQTSSTQRLENVLARLRCYDLDLSVTEEVNKCVEDFKPEVIIHFATQYAINHKLEHIASMIQTNLIGTCALLEAAKTHNVRLFVNTSSCFVYQPSQEKVSETSPCQPINFYALTKWQAEKACSFYAEQYGLPCVTLRIFAPYGPADQERRLIPYLVKSYFAGVAPQATTGKQQWDFVYIDDIVEAYRKVLAKEKFLEKHEILNIGSGDTVSIREIGLHLQKLMNSELAPQWGSVPHRENELWYVCADIRKANTVLSWAPQTKILESGLKLTAEWFKNAQELNRTGR